MAEIEPDSEEYFNETCDCELKPEHKRGQHDFCCQRCGGAHTDDICPKHLKVFVPKSATTKREMDLVRLTQLLVEGKATVKTCGLLGGEFGYGTEFENDVFMMHPFCWCEQDDCKWCREDAPHFIHKKSGLEIHWYKWIGRDMRYSMILSDRAWGHMIKECMESVKK